MSLDWIVYTVMYVVLPSYITKIMKTFVVLEKINFY